MSPSKYKWCGSGHVLERWYWELVTLACSSLDLCIVTVKKKTIKMSLITTVSNRNYASHPCNDYLLYYIISKFTLVWWFNLELIFIYTLPHHARAVIVSSFNVLFKTSVCSKALYILTTIVTFHYVKCIKIRVELDQCKTLYNFVS